MKYLADSSYWVYLVHFPIVGLIQANLFGLPISSALKFAIALGLTLALGLSSYQVMVRHTVIGRWLHGSRARDRRGVDSRARDEARYGCRSIRATTRPLRGTSTRGGTTRSGVVPLMASTS